MYPVSDVLFIFACGFICCLGVMALCGKVL